MEKFDQDLDSESNRNLLRRQLDFTVPVPVEASVGTKMESESEKKNSVIESELSREDLAGEELVSGAELKPPPPSSSPPVKSLALSATEVVRMLTIAMLTMNLNLRGLGFFYVASKIL